ncbi:NADH-quinone oxidoreductase subunit NdhO [Leptolyngbyaceae cyanobacterium JSC-12]|nr:NADH-quinone oxidoreductase subunit NdhO [Leptolyngbyaceae cyanobacterium JSC-12]
MSIKRGDFVRAIREKLENSLEAKASDARFPSYIFETKGEVVDLSGDYALVKFGITPTPNIWLRQDQLESVEKVDGTNPYWLIGKSQA